MTDFLLLMAFICFMLGMCANFIKVKVFGLVPVTEFEKLLSVFLDLQFVFALLFAGLAALSVM